MCAHRGSTKLNRGSAPKHLTKPNLYKKKVMVTVRYYYLFYLSGYIFRYNNAYMY